MVPRGQLAMHEGLGFYNEIVKNCSEFHEMTGEIGDVILLHPLRLHSASKNSLRIPRIITNPPVSLRESFNLTERIQMNIVLWRKKLSKSWERTDYLVGRSKVRGKRLFQKGLEFKSK
jgi:hypothetical protein